MPPLKFINHRIDDYALQVSYLPGEERGKVIYNLSLIMEQDAEEAIRTLQNAYKSGLCVSDRVSFTSPGTVVDNFTIPEGRVGIVTVCSITLDAILLRSGVPAKPVAGGAVEIENRIPRRFTNLILYEHTTTDPLEVLISQDITSVNGVMTKGSGTILANLRECHMEAEALVGDVLDELADAGFTGILDVGVPNAPLLGVPVSPEYLGVAMVGGTNPIAAFKENGYWAQTRALKGLIDIEEMGYISDY